MKGRQEAKSATWAVDPCWLAPAREALNGHAFYLPRPVEESLNQENLTEFAHTWQQNLIDVEVLKSFEQCWRVSGPSSFKLVPL